MAPPARHVGESASNRNTYIIYLHKSAKYRNIDELLDYPLERARATHLLTTTTTTTTTDDDRHRLVGSRAFMTLFNSEQAFLAATQYLVPSGLLVSLILKLTCEYFHLVFVGPPPRPPTTGARFVWLVLSATPFILTHSSGPQLRQ